MNEDEASSAGRDTLPPLSPGAIPGYGLVTRRPDNLSFMHRPPAIVPNYGRMGKSGAKLKTKIPRVLLYDNVTQQSMLEVQISGIQSQCYKTERQLQMAMKAFLIQKQIKDRALRKITQVHHGEDYIEFEHDYHKQSLADNMRTINDQDDGKNMLPNIYAKNGCRRRQGRKRAKFHIMNCVGGIGNWDDEQQNKIQPETQGDYIDKLQDGFEPSSQDDIRPALKGDINPAPQSDINPAFKGNMNHAPLSDIHPELQSKMISNYSQVRNSGKFAQATKDRSYISKVTADDTRQNEHSMATKCSLPFLENVHSSLQNNNVEINGTVSKMHIFQKDLTETDAAINFIPQMDLNTKMEDGPNTDVLNSDGVMFHECATRRSAKERGKIKRAIFDYRFELLQKVLVRQLPPNEGFTELSPSFVRQNPLKRIRETLALLRMSESQVFQK